MTREKPSFYPPEASFTSVDEEKGRPKEDVELPDENLYRFLFGIDKKEPQDFLALKYIKKAIAELDEQEQLVINKSLEGKTVAEIAREMKGVRSKKSMDEGVVNQIYYRAVRKITHKLALWEKPSEVDITNRRKDFEEKSLPDSATHEIDLQALWGSAIKRFRKKIR